MSAEIYLDDRGMLLVCLNKLLFINTHNYKTKRVVKAEWK